MPSFVSHIVLFYIHLLSNFAVHLNKIGVKVKKLELKASFATQTFKVVFALTECRTCAKNLVKRYELSKSCHFPVAKMSSEL